MKKKRKKREREEEDPFSGAAHGEKFTRGVCVCVCVCVRERERERGTESIQLLSSIWLNGNEKACLLASY